MPGSELMGSDPDSARLAPAHGKLTVTVMITGTAAPFRNVGS
jgi:hypothetical protein